LIRIRAGSVYDLDNPVMLPPLGYFGFSGDDYTDKFTDFSLNLNTLAGITVIP